MDYLQKGIEDVVFCFLRFPSGRVAHMHLSWLDPHKERRLTVVGASGAGRSTMLKTILGVTNVTAGDVIFGGQRITHLSTHGRIARGVAYGTLPGHLETGEERFLIEMDERGVVWYDILAFSRPRRFLVRLGYPYVRRLQKRFGRHSAAAMQKATAEISPAAC